MLWVFCFRHEVKWKASSLAPALICAGVTASVCAVEWLGEATERFTVFKRLEWITYDWRVREAAKQSPPVANNLGFVAMDEESIHAVSSGSLPYRFGLLWPRQVYARMVDELSAQGAKAIGFDILLAELRPDHPPVELDGKTTSSDEFFARSLTNNNNVVLASDGTMFPPELFATNALAVGHISAEREHDGILRRTHAFVDARVWHPLIQAAARTFGWDLARSKQEPDKLIFPRRYDAETNVLPLNAEGLFNAGMLERAMAGDSSRPVGRHFAQPFRDERLWQLGIVLAARELNLDLKNATVDLKGGHISLTGPEAVQRVIPVDREGRLLIDWSLGVTDRRLTKGAIESLLEQHESRRAGRMEEVTNLWKNKLVFVGSIALGNNLSDMGATPLEGRTYLVSNHWNVANSVLMNRFIRPLHLSDRLFIIALFSIFAGLCTWRMRTLAAVGSVIGLAVVYIALAFSLFITSRIWLPIVTPVGGALALTHVCLITHLVRVERRGHQRTKGIFSRVVAPDIMQELLGVEKLSLGGGRRHVTIFFADIRDFTGVTDAIEERAKKIVAERKLIGQAAENCFDAEAETVLRTVNPYLSIIADVIKKHGGTLDKFIGDCVMAFWGAPVPNPRHAVCCVRAAIDAQRAIFQLNLERQAENQRREEENLRRHFRGEEPLPLLNVLTLGSGINTGAAITGMLGSENHVMNYTVFGREVNLASRLEGASGNSRILIGESTYREILRDDPELAAACNKQGPLVLKGFRDSVTAYEVPWRPRDVSATQAGQTEIIVRDAGAGI